MSENASDTEKTLNDLRSITMLTGEISSVHEKNLKTWPYILFDDIEEMEIKYDLSKDYTKEVGEGYISFYVQLAQLEYEDLLKRCEAITSWARDLFWREIKVSVYFNNVKIYANSTIESAASEPEYKNAKVIKEKEDGPK